MTSAERMQNLRMRRKSSGVIEFKLWIKEDILKELKMLLKSIELFSLNEEKTQELKELKDTLYKKLSENKTWEDYYLNRYQMPPAKSIGLKSTENQRKFAYVVSRAVGVTLPNNFTLSNKILLAEWIKKQIETYKLQHIYDWEEIAKEYKFNNG